MQLRPASGQASLRLGDVWNGLTEIRQSTAHAITAAARRQLRLGSGRLHPVPRPMRAQHQLTRVLQVSEKHLLHHRGGRGLVQRAGDAQHRDVERGKQVAPFEADPLGEHRIKVQLPALPSDQGVVWARFMHPDAGKERGFVFWPEAGDEVVVGFLGGDPGQPIVLGALHGKPTLPDHLAPSDTNDMRVIASRGGSFIRFDDKKNQIVLSTPAGATVTLDDDKKTIVLADQNGNGIELNDKGITITSAKDLTITSANDLTITSAKDLTLEASGKVVIKGTAVDVQ